LLPHIYNRLRAMYNNDGSFFQKMREMQQVGAQSQCRSLQ